MYGSENLYQEGRGDALYMALSTILTSMPGKDIKAYKQQLCTAILCGEQSREEIVEALRRDNLWPMK